VAKLIAKEHVSDAYIYFMFRQPEFQKRLEMISTGVAQQNLSPIHMGELEVVYPSKEQLHYCSEVATPIIKQLLTLWKKNNNLKSQRDSILPRLISGKVLLEVDNEYAR
jgi:type I restriction enzyme S subunit